MSTSMLTACFDPVANKMMRADTLTQHQVAIFVWNEMSFNVMNFLVNGAV